MSSRTSNREAETTPLHPEKHLSIFETTARLLDEGQQTNELSVDQRQTMEAVRELLSSLGIGNMPGVERSLVKLGVHHNQELFQQVGSLTRSLHSALDEFKSSLFGEAANMATIKLPAAADKLEAVIKSTYVAAERTLELSEKQADCITSAHHELSTMRSRLAHLSDEEMIRQVSSFLDNEEARLRELQKMNSQVLMAQEYQDLTGQALRKVIKLVTGLEKNLIALIKIFGHEITSDIGDNKPAADLDQNDVDSILDSFGF